MDHSMIGKASLEDSFRRRSNTRIPATASDFTGKTQKTRNTLHEKLKKIYVFL
jgi:hypothetical protein